MIGFLLQLTLGIALPWALVRWDMTRLAPARRARAWPDSSLLAAAVAFGPLCLPFHFVKTRGWLWGLLLGALALLGCALGAALPGMLLEALEP